MDKIEALRREVLSLARSSDDFERRLTEYENAVRAQEREETLARIRHSVHALRNLANVIRQEVAVSVGPLEELCDDLESRVQGTAPAHHLVDLGP